MPSVKEMLDYRVGKILRSLKIFDEMLDYRVGKILRSLKIFDERFLAMVGEVRAIKFDIRAIMERQLKVAPKAPKRIAVHKPMSKRKLSKAMKLLYGDSK